MELALLEREIELATQVRQFAIAAGRQPLIVSLYQLRIQVASCIPKKLGSSRASRY